MVTEHKILKAPIDTAVNLSTYNVYVNGCKYKIISSPVLAYDQAIQIDLLLHAILLLCLLI